LQIDKGKTQICLKWI